MIWLLFLLLRLIITVHKKCHSARNCFIHGVNRNYSISKCNNIICRSSNSKIKYLIEVKAIGISLKENHLRQAINYGSQEGVQWVVLTNGIEWNIHRIKFEQPISHELVCSFNFQALNPKKNDMVEMLYLLCREGLLKDRTAIEEYHEYTQIINRYTLAAIICAEPCLNVIRRELKRLAPGTKLTNEEIFDFLPDVLKREVLEGEEAKQAGRKIKRAASKNLRKQSRKTKEKEDTDAQSTDNKPEENNTIQENSN